MAIINPKRIYIIIVINSFDTCCTHRFMIGEWACCIKQRRWEYMKATATATTTTKNDGLSNEMILYDSRDNVGAIHMHTYIKYTLKWSNPRRSVHIYLEHSFPLRPTSRFFFVLIGEKGRNLFMNNWQQQQQQKKKSPESTFFQIKMLRHPYLHI